jgi:toxin FitB
VILDSNIIIYAALPEHADLRQFIAKHTPAVSAVSVVEVLGYHLIPQTERVTFEAFFQAVEVLPVSESVIARAVQLRQIRKMSLGDALIAATALVFQRELLTRNISDFHWIPDITLRNPITP